MRHSIVIAVVLGAFFGSVVSQYFRLIVIVFFGQGGAGAGWVARLADAGTMLVSGAFLSPWGWFGAMVGGGWAWRRLVLHRRRATGPATETEAGADPDPKAGPLRKGEGSLAGGLALLGVAGFLAPQVMLGLMALMMAPVVLALLIIGAWRVRDPDLPSGRQALGFILLLLALGGLLMTTVFAIDTNARDARLSQIRQDRMRAVQSAHPSVLPEDPAAAALRAQIEADLENLSRHPAYAPPERRQLAAAAFWLTPVFMGVGLSCRAGWSPWRCLFWAGVVWVFPYGMARLVQACGVSMVFSA